MTEQAVAVAIGKLLDRDLDQSGAGDGLCVDCRNPIPAERLEVFPDAARCVRCQGEWEQANPL
jgi:phage/conjugal plasmid C-4 type zinc finger TraR family protein